MAVNNTNLAHILVFAVFGAITGVFVGINLYTWGDDFLYETLCLTVPLVMFAAVMLFYSFCRPDSKIAMSISALLGGYVVVAFTVAYFCQ